MAISDPGLRRAVAIIQAVAELMPENDDRAIALFQAIASIADATNKQRADQHGLEAAAKKLAECFDYPWEHMPEQGRQQMRDHAASVIEAGVKSD